MSEKYEVVKFKNEEFELDVNIDPNNETNWLTQKQLSLIFNVNSQAITKQLQKLYIDNELDFSSTCSILEQVQIEGGRKI